MFDPRTFVRNIPLVGRLLRTAVHALRGLVVRRRFPGSQDYWERRYGRGETSGCGSYGDLAAFKAEVLNDLVAREGIKTVIEFGCGDGNQVALATYPDYVGFDVSTTAVALCRERFAGDPSKRFAPLTAYAGETAELALSLDVVYHLIEDEAFEAHMRTLFGAATRFVAVYSSDTDRNAPSQAPHVRHRNFTAWIDRNIAGWSLYRHVPNRYPYDPETQQGSFADFYIYAATQRGADTDGRSQAGQS